MMDRESCTPCLVDFSLAALEADFRKENWSSIMNQKVQQAHL